MFEKNHGFVTWEQETTYYHATISDPTADSESDLLLEAAAGLLDAFDRLVVPLKVTFKHRDEGPDSDSHLTADVRSDEPEALRKDGGIQAADVRRFVESEANATESSLERIVVADAAARIFFDHGERLVPRQSPFYRIQTAGEIRDGVPETPVWHIYLRPSLEDSDADAPTVRASIGTPTSLYFDVYENRISRINAARFHRCLASFRRRTGASDVEVRKDNFRVSTTIAEELISGAIGHPEKEFPHWPDDEAMIEAYRADWWDENAALSVGEDQSAFTVELSCPERMGGEELTARVMAAHDAGILEVEDGDHFTVACNDFLVQGYVRKGKVYWRTGSAR